MKSKYHAALVIVRLVSTALENCPLHIETSSRVSSSAEQFTRAKTALGMLKQLR
jgi:hypothetical protein